MTREDQLVLRKKRKAEEEAAKATRKTAAKSKVAKGVPSTENEVEEQAEQREASSEAPAPDGEPVFGDVETAPAPKKKGWPKGKAKAKPAAKDNSKLAPKPKAKGKAKAKPAAKAKAPSKKAGKEQSETNDHEGNMSQVEEAQEEGDDNEPGDVSQKAPAAKSVAAKTKEALARGKAEVDAKAKASKASTDKKAEGKAASSCDSDICPTN